MKLKNWSYFLYLQSKKNKFTLESRIKRLTISATASLVQGTRSDDMGRSRSRLGLRTRHSTRAVCAEHRKTPLACIYLYYLNILNVYLQVVQGDTHSLVPSR